MTPTQTRFAALPSSGSRDSREELAANVGRFEHLVAEHSDYLRRIEMLLDEIEVNCKSDSDD